MKGIFLFISSIGMIFSLFSGVFSDIRLPVVAAQTIQPHLSQQPILNATVQILMFAEGDQTTLAARGLGTFVHSDNETFIVTHDHWGDFIVTATYIEFRDAQGNFLLGVNRQQFLNLIRYRDAGTMVLTAPNDLNAAPIAPLSTETIVPGAIVTLVHRQQGEDGVVRVETMPATVTAVEEKENRPVFILRSLEGQPIRQGDSGGGVWLNGRLVGNMWATELTAGWRLGYWSISTDTTPTDTSIAAQFPQLSTQHEQVVDLISNDAINEIAMGDIE